MKTYNFFANCNDYWQAKQYGEYSAKEMKDMLAERNYHTGSVKDKIKLRRSLQRTDRGLLSYINFNNVELRNLVRDRRIQTNFGLGNIGARRDLITALENDDEHPKFHRFLDLPPELRGRVFDYYFTDFKNKYLHAPKQPPLTLTCGLVRKEALPLFYATCRFELNLVRSKAGHAAVWPTKLRIPLETSMWIHNTRPENMVDIRHIRVHVWDQYRMYGDIGYYRVSGFHIDIVIGDDGQVRLIIDDKEVLYTADQHDSDKDLFIEQVIKINERAKTRGLKGLGLVGKHFFNVRSAMEDLLAEMVR